MKYIVKTTTYENKQIILDGISEYEVSNVIDLPSYKGLTLECEDSVADQLSTDFASNIATINPYHEVKFRTNL